MDKLIRLSPINCLEAGLDEVGRGSLAGPVVAAAVILPYDYYHPKLNDSKKMTPKNRQIVYEDLIKNAESYCISFVSESHIDEINIENASMLAMHRAIDGLDRTPDVLMVDGNKFKKYNNIEHHCIVKGDSKIISIAAASVLAKVRRDEYMVNLSKHFTDYKWDSNKGYGTKEHMSAITKYGINEHHRKTFIHLNNE